MPTGTFDLILLEHQVSIPRALAILVFIAILPLPYGYYQFLRVAVCLGVVYCLVANLNTLSNVEKGGLLVTAILYNPFAPLYMVKMIWIVINIGAGIFLWSMRKTND